MTEAATVRPLIVGIGGTAVPDSSTERALAVAIAAAERAGARVRLFGAATLAGLPLYLTAPCREPAAELIESVRQADGLIIASPGYHGSVSGLVKNALDHLEALSGDERAYLDGVPVGLIATAYGWQATGSTLATLRAIVHALRGWPTPLGAAVNCFGKIFEGGRCVDAVAAANLELVGRQVFDFVSLKRASGR